MKSFALAMAVLFLALQYALWFGDKSLLHLHSQHQATEQTRQQNQTLQQGNEKLVVEVNDLKKGGETVETLARSQFGLIKKGETFYQIIE